MTRVTQRALLGKHYIPMETLIQRYAKSLTYFIEKYRPIADFWLMADNSNIKINPISWGGNIYGNQNFYSIEKIR
jgi:predicted ABC-type ATPase